MVGIDILSAPQCEAYADWHTYVYAKEDQPRIHLCAQTPLFSLSPFEVLNMTFPLGNHTFYFAIDDPDGTATGP